MRLKYGASCDLCGASVPRYLGETHGKSYLKCQVCGLYYLDNRPNDTVMAEIYAKDFFHEEYVQAYGKDYASDRENIERFAKARLDTIEKFRKPGTILDVGCAFGFFLSVAQNRGWKPYGIEISEYATNYAREKLKLKNVEKKSIDGADFPKEMFDCITFWLVFEHMRFPNRILSKVWKWLKLSGILGLKMPHADGLTFRGNFQKWLKDHSGDHYCEYTIDTITAMLFKHGFEVIHSETEGIYLDRALDLINDPKLRFEKSDPIYPVIESFYRQISFKLNLGDSLVIIAKKIDKTQV